MEWECVCECGGKEHWLYPFAAVVVGVLCGIHYIANIVRVGSVYFAVHLQPYICEHAFPRTSIVHYIQGGRLNNVGNNMRNVLDGGFHRIQ